MSYKLIWFQLGNDLFVGALVIHNVLSGIEPQLCVSKWSGHLLFVVIQINQLLRIFFVCNNFGGYSEPDGHLRSSFFSDVFALSHQIHWCSNKQISVSLFTKSFNFTFLVFARWHYACTRFVVLLGFSNLGLCVFVHWPVIYVSTEYLLFLLICFFLVSLGYLSARALFYRNTCI